MVALWKHDWQSNWFLNNESQNIGLTSQTLAYMQINAPPCQFKSPRSSRGPSGSSTKNGRLSTLPAHNMSGIAIMAFVASVGSLQGCEQFGSLFLDSRVKECLDFRWRWIVWYLFFHGRFASDFESG